jgi:hypothetical protein
MPSSPAESAVLTVAEIGLDPLRRLLARFGLALRVVAPGAPIPGSYWGEPEAGLQGGHLHVRADTPVHSALHEACHWICMTADRRRSLDTDAGGDYAEEDAVCFLQIVLADGLPPLDRARMCRDMDRWGYTFRLGCAAAWFREDAADAHAWLVGHGLMDSDGRPTWRVRGTQAA